MTDMTVAEVARVCGVTERTVRRWLREGRLPARRVGGRVRIATEAVRELAAPYGAAPETPSGEDRATDDWWAALQDPARLASVDRRRVDHAMALMDQVRAMAIVGAARPASDGLIREMRDEQDARWDEHPR